MEGLDDFRDILDRLREGLVNPITLDADLDEPAVSETPLITQGDSIVFTVNVLKAGEPFILDPTMTATLVVRRSDGEVVIAKGAVNGTNQVVFKLRRRATLALGTTRFTVQLYDHELERVSTMFGVYVVMEDISDSLDQLPEDEQGLIQQVLGEGPAVIEAAAQAAVRVDNFIGDELESGMLRTRIDEKLTGLEEDYAPKLTDVARKVEEKAQKSELMATGKRIDELVIESGNANAEVSDAHVSVVKNRTFPTIRTRFEEVEEEMIIVSENLPLQNMVEDVKRGLDAWRGDGSTLSFNDGVITVRGSGGSALPRASHVIQTPVVLENKFFISFKAKVDNTECQTLDVIFGARKTDGAFSTLRASGIGAKAINNPSKGVWYTFKGIVTVRDGSYTDITSVQPTHTYATAEVARDKNMEFYDVTFINLSEFYGFDVPEISEIEESLDSKLSVNLKAALKSSATRVDTNLFPDPTLTDDSFSWVNYSTSSYIPGESLVLNPERRSMLHKRTTTSSLQSVGFEFDIKDYALKLGDTVALNVNVLNMVGSFVTKSLIILGLNGNTEVSRETRVVSVGGNAISYTLPEKVTKIRVRFDMSSPTLGDFMEFSDITFTTNSRFYENGRMLVDRMSLKKELKDIGVATNLFPDPLLVDDSFSWANYLVQYIPGETLVLNPERRSVLYNRTTTGSLQVIGFEFDIKDYALKVGDTLKLGINFLDVVGEFVTRNLTIMGLNGNAEVSREAKQIHPGKATLTYTLPENCNRVRVRFDMSGPLMGTYIEFSEVSLTTDSAVYENGRMLVDHMSLNKKLKNIGGNGGGGGNGPIVRYVGLNGKDTNTGTSQSSPYATVNKAIEDGATVIYIQQGIYYNQSIVAPNKESIKLLPWAHGSYDSSNVETPKVVFRGSDLLSTWTPYNSIFRQAYNQNNPYFNNVFINKTTPPESEGTRPSFNATIWEGNNRQTDIKLKPVLTLAACEAERGTFFYDGNYVYVNPTDGVVANKEFHAVRLGVGIDLTGTKQVVMQDIEADFYHSHPMRVRNISDLRLQSCAAGHSGTTDGFMLDNSNGVLISCKAFKNRNDGFNIHFYGDTTFINCDGFNNYDDGISHHELSTGHIIGGNWYGNVKGGIIPVNRARVNVEGVRCWGNAHGIYFSGENDLENVFITISNSEVFGNTNGIRIGQAYDAAIRNCVIRDNTNGIYVSGNPNIDVDSSEITDNDIGIYDNSEENVKIRDCKISDNPTGYRKTGTGQTDLERNNILFSSTVAINASTGKINVIKRNNLYGNTADYSGSQPVQAEKDKNVAVPTV